MQVAIVDSIITGVFALIVAWFGYVTTREKKAREEDERIAEEREKQAQERDERIMALLYANSEANRVTLRYLHGEQLNGDVTRALDRLDDALDEYSSIRDHIAASL